MQTRLKYFTAQNPLPRPQFRSLRQRSHSVPTCIP